MADEFNQQKKQSRHTFGRVATRLADRIRWVAHTLQLTGKQGVVGQQIALHSEIINDNSGGGRNAQLMAAHFQATNKVGSGTDKPLGEVIGTQIEVQNTAGGYIDEAIGLDLSLRNNGIINSAFGIRLADVDQGQQDNYALHTGKGIVHLGDELELDGTLNHIGTYVGFRGAAPVEMPSPTEDIKDSLQAVGLLHPTDDETNLDLDGGRLKASWINLSPLETAEATLWFHSAAGGERWTIAATDHPETGSNAGTNLEIRRYADDGDLIDTVVAFNRATGLVTFNENVYVAEDIEIDGVLNHDGTTLGFRGATPVSMPTATADIKDSLQAIGLLHDANSASPLNLDGGLMSAGHYAFTAFANQDLAGRLYRDSVGNIAVNRSHPNTTSDAQKNVLSTAFAVKTTNTPVDSTSFLSIGGWTGSLDIPDDFWTVGKTLRITLGGYSTANAVGDRLRLKLNLGSQIFDVKTHPYSTNTFTFPFEWNVLLTCRSVGSTGSIFPFVQFNGDNGEVGSADQLTSAVTVNTTTSNSITIDSRWLPNTPGGPAGDAVYTHGICEWLW